MHALLSSAILSTALVDLPVGPLAPVVIPKLPKPNWSWNTIPLSFHGAVKDREYTDKEVAYLAKFLMYTPEKWYTPCGSQGPAQAGPSCAIESKTERLFARIRRLNPNMTTILYWNSMFDFSFYSAHQGMLDLEAAGTHAFLRDEHGEVIMLCNDGNGAHVALQRACCCVPAGKPARAYLWLPRGAFAGAADQPSSPAARTDKHNVSCLPAQCTATSRLLIGRSLRCGGFGSSK